ncbi:MAG: MFS transporter [Candidatus Heimdallarchaeota archaeon]
MMDRRLWPVMLSVGVWHLGYSLYGPFVSLWILRDLGNPSFFVLAIVISLPAMASIVGISFLSRLADQKKKLRELLSVTAFAGALQFVCLRLFARSTGTFLLVALPLGMFTMAYYTLAAALATNICDPEVKGQVSSYLLIFASLGWSIGSFGSGRAFRLFGMHTVLLMAAFFLIIAGCLVFASPRGQSEETSPNPPSTDEDVSLTSLLGNHQIRLVLVITALVEFGTGGLFMLSTIFFVEGAGVLEDDFGVANSIATLIAFPILFFIGKGMDSNMGRRFFLRLAVMLHLLYFVAFSLTRDPVILLLLWVIPMYAFLSPALTAMMADLTDISERSRGMGLLQTVYALMPGLGMILGGLAADSFGLFVLPLIGLLFLPFALYLTFIVSETQAKEITPEEIPTTTISDSIAAWLFSLDSKV